MARFVISGTGTEIGKTVFAAGLAGFLNAPYWKPVQSGVADGLDRDRVAALAGVACHPESYLLTEPLSPHRAAELDGVEIDLARLIPPEGDLIIEGAGGVLVPLNRRTLFADLFAQWQIPVVLCATTGLGTISHSLTAIESLRARNVPLHGIAFIGPDNPDTIATIAAFGKVKVLGRLPHLAEVTPARLALAIAAGFNRSDFITGAAA
ncbi:MAG: dethiobiotin synthase [Paracoccus sp. (in: a-proteobacteria)]|nr:dethiobiotin synthase [Paracoccus sp. (in: a-proteobacteria)]